MKIDSEVLKKEINKQQQAGATAAASAFNLGLTVAISLVEAEEKFEQIRGKK